MAEIRYSLKVDGTEVAGSYANPSPVRSSGDVQVKSLSFVSERLVTIGAGASLDLDTTSELGGKGSDTYLMQFVAVRPSAAVYVSRAGTSTEEWQIAADGWMMMHLAAEARNLNIRNASSSDDVTVLIMLGGT
jgi:hypothetical protein